MADRIGYGHGYTLLRLGGTHADTTALIRAFAAIGAPLQVLDISDEHARDLYGRDLLLLRPDLHVVWRGDAAPPSRKNWRRSPQAIDDRPRPARLATGESSHGLTPPTRSNRWSCAIRYRRGRAARLAADKSC